MINIIVLIVKVMLHQIIIYVINVNLMKYMLNNNNFVSKIIIIHLIVYNIIVINFVKNVNKIII